jgi:hypothetical protein
MNKPIAISLLACLTLNMAHAESPVAGSDDTSIQVRKLKDQAKSIRLEAGLAFKAKQDECSKKLFSMADDCLNDARQAKKKALAQARVLEDQAADIEPIRDEEKSQIKARIVEIKAEATAIRSTADRLLKAQQAECLGKFLVNACVEEAKQAQRSSVESASDLEQLARDLEQQVRKRELVTRAEKRREKALHQEAEDAAFAAKSRSAN